MISQKPVSIQVPGGHGPGCANMGTWLWSQGSYGLWACPAQGEVEGPRPDCPPLFSPLPCIPAPARGPVTHRKAILRADKPLLRTPTGTAQSSNTGPGPQVILQSPDWMHNPPPSLPWLLAEKTVFSHGGSSQILDINFQTSVFMVPPMSTSVWGLLGHTQRPLRGSWSSN